MTKQVERTVLSNNDLNYRHWNYYVEDDKVAAETASEYAEHVECPKLTVISNVKEGSAYRPAEVVVVRHARYYKPETPLNKMRYIEFKLESALQAMGGIIAYASLRQQSENLHTLLLQVKLMRMVIERFPEARKVQYACFEDRSVGMQPEFDEIVILDAAGNTFNGATDEEDEVIDEAIESIYNKANVELAGELLLLEPQGVIDYNDLINTEGW